MNTKPQTKTGRLSFWISLTLILALIMIASCSETSITNNDDQSDGDVDDLVLHACGNGAGDGNPAQVLVAFAVHNIDVEGTAVSWSDGFLRFDGVFMAERNANGCGTESGRWLPSEEGGFEMPLDTKSDHRIDISMPTDRDFCAIDFRFPATGGMIELNGQTRDDQPIRIQTRLGGFLPFTPESSSFRFSGGEKLHWLASLALDRIMSEFMLSQVEADPDGSLRIDEMHNSDLLPEINRAIVSAFVLVKDDGNGRLDEEELNPDRKIGKGAEDRLIFDPPVDGDINDGDATDGDATDGDATDGDATDGDTSDGDTIDGDTTDGDTSDGDTTDGDASDGDTTDGDTTDGDVTDGDVTDGDVTDGDTTDGDSDGCQIQDDFSTGPRPLIDVLFVVDCSGSMGEEQAMLAENFNTFINMALDWEALVQIGITTCDIEAQGGQLVCPPISNYGAEALDREAFISHFGECVNVGMDCSGTEACIEASVLSLSGAGTGNYMSLREDAKLVVIYVSDEDDQSSADLAFYIDFLRSIKGMGHPELLECYAICGDVPNGCLSAEPGTRYVSLADACNPHDDAHFASICQDDFTPIYEQFGENVFTVDYHIILTHVPIVETIQVWSNGTLIEGWTYDDVRNEILFPEDHPLRAGMDIRVIYDYDCR